MDGWMGAGTLIALGPVLGMARHGVRNEKETKCEE